MPEAVVSATSVVTGWLLTYLLHSSVLLGAALLARLVICSPSTRDALGKAAMVGSVLTATLAWNAGPQVRTIRVTSANAELLTALGTVNHFDERAEWMMQDLGKTLMVTGPVEWAKGVLLVVWLAGGLVGLLRLFRARAGVAAIRRTLAACNPRAIRLVTGLVPSKPLRVRSSRLVETPCVLPGGVVVLSERAEQLLDDRALTAVLAHEIGHVVRRDAGWFTALEGLAAVVWLQPLNRLTLGLLRSNAELACDDWAVARTGAPADLAQTIVTVAAWGVAPPVAGTMPMTRSGRSASARVERLLSGGVRGGPTWGAAALGAALLVTGLQIPAVHVPREIHAAFFETPGVAEVLVRDFVSDGGEGGRLQRARVVVRRFEGG